MKLATVISHPIQYYAPWFKHISQNTYIENKVFYLWDYGVKKTYDRDFKVNVNWNIPLLDGYRYEILRNKSKSPGTYRFDGLNNPDLVDKLLKYNSDAILMFGYLSLSQFCVLFDERLSKTPKIIKGDSHRLFYENSLKNTLKNLLIQEIFKKFSLALFVGSANKDYFLKYGFRNHQLFFSPHAVDNERFFPDEISREKTRRSLNIAKKNRVILFCGKFENKKCPLELAETFTQCNEKELRLLYVGSGKLEHEILSYAAKDKRISVIGYVDQKSIPDFYRASDYVVLPSYGCYETWGFCLHEALACGCCVISSSHVGSSHDLISEKRNGYIFPAGDWDALLKIFYRLQLNEHQADDVVEYNLGLMRKYSYDNATKGLLAAVEFLINEK